MPRQGGDFYLPTIDWSSDLVAGYIRPINLQFLDCFSLLGLMLWVREPTFLLSDNTQDPVLASEEDRVDEVSVLPPLPCSQHSPVDLEYIFRGRGRSMRSVGKMSLAKGKVQQNFRGSVSG